MTAPQDPFSTPPPGGGAAPGSGTPAGGAPAWGESTGGHDGYGTAPGAGYGAPGTGPARNGLGVAALVLGILAFFTGVFFVGAALGVAAIVLGVLGRGRAKRGEATNGGMALAGIILGVIGILMTVAVVAGAAAFLKSDTGQQLQDCLERAGQDVEAQQQCQVEIQERVGS